MNLRPTALIRDSIDALMRDIAQLRGEVAGLRRANEALRAENEVLRGENAAVRGDNEALRSENAALRAEVAELRRRLDLDSSTSSKPPSSDGLKKKPRVPGSLRGRSGKKSGGQAGHKGDTLKQVEAPDRIERHTANVCRRCLSSLTAAMQTGVEKRQVFDLPERLIEVTEHQASIYCCAACGFETKAAFPAGVAAAAQYGERIRAAAIYLNVQQLIPEDRVAQTMNDLFGAPLLCPASLTSWVENKAAALAGVARHIGVLAAQAPVRHVDETGFRVAGKGRWLHTVSTETLTFYRVSEKRGAIAESLTGGVVVHDHFKPYYGLTGVAHAFCNAHHLRELKALIEIDEEPWAKDMSDLLVEANEAVRAARQERATALAPAAIEGFLARYWKAIRAGLAYHRSLPPLERRARGRTKRRPGHNLLERLKTYKDGVLRFLCDFTVPFTNNLAEQALRMMKVKMKISGAFRTFEGAADFAALRSVVATARKRGWSILRTLTAQPHPLIQALSA
jgi:transposase